MMTIAESPDPLIEAQPENSHKRWTKAIILFSVLVFLCVTSFCVFGAIGVVEGMKPKTNPVLYSEASISHMFDACTPDRYLPWETWMVPVSGTHTVLAIYYTKSAPAPEALTAFNLFIQIDPELIEPGQVLSFPSQGVEPFLLQTRPPSMVCSAELSGSVDIGEVSASSIKTRLEVSGKVVGDDWDYNAELEFRTAPLPR